MAAETYRELGESAWLWVLDQVRWDDGPWLPVALGGIEPRADRDGYHSGVGGIAYLLAEIRLWRPWTNQEAELAAGIADRLQRSIAGSEDYTFFDGLAATIGTLLVLGADGTEQAVSRLRTLARPDGWEPHILDLPPAPERRYPDATLGTAGILLAAVWALRHEVPGARALTGSAAVSC